jgi:hypothetical protein
MAKLEDVIRVLIPLGFESIKVKTCMDSMWDERVQHLEGLQRAMGCLELDFK